MTKNNKITTVKCPTCKKIIHWTPKQKYKPFCSERCRLIDLGDWFEEEHRIAEQNN
ncbi:MAG: DNA gyrase inhibitor YacG [Methylococcales bacterium]|nr:DNA gyrase inhibitor YacG [Methylococcales bacterium]MBT7409094.1 DNA gyrase inhibitor YacG [Methylococcales bacterium]